MSATISISFESSQKIKMYILYLMNPLMYRLFEVISSDFTERVELDRPNKLMTIVAVAYMCSFIPVLSATVATNEPCLKSAKKSMIT